MPTVVTATKGFSPCSIFTSMLAIPQTPSCGIGQDLPDEWIQPQNMCHRKYHGDVFNADPGRDACGGHSDTMAFGKPYGRARMTLVQSVVPCVPPIATTP